MVLIMKKTIISSFLVIFLLTISQVSFGFTFWGIEIGKSLQDQMVKCPEFGKDWVPIKDVCYRNEPFIKDSYNIDHLPDLDFITITKVKTINDKIEGIIVELWGNPNFYSVNFDKYYKSLTSIYGKRKSFSTKTIKNKMGAKLKKINVIWNIENCTIHLTNIGSDIEHGLLTVTSKVYDKSIKDQNKKKKDETKR
jgi:hypothetical protein